MSKANRAPRSLALSLTVNWRSVVVLLHARYRALDEDIHPLHRRWWRQRPCLFTRARFELRTPAENRSVLLPRSRWVLPSCRLERRPRTSSRRLPKIVSLATWLLSILKGQSSVGHRSPQHGVDKSGPRHETENLQKDRWMMPHRTEKHVATSGGSSWSQVRTNRSERLSKMWGHIGRAPLWRSPLKREVQISGEVSSWIWWTSLKQVKSDGQLRHIHDVWTRARISSSCEIICSFNVHTARRGGHRINC